LLDGLDGDKEGFTAEVYRFIQKNHDLNAITNMANASLYSIRGNCDVYSTRQQYLTSLNKNEVFHSLIVERDADGNVIPHPNPANVEVEIIKNEDFFGIVLKDMNLKRYVDIPEE